MPLLTRLVLAFLIIVSIATRSYEMIGAATTTVAATETPDAVPATTPAIAPAVWNFPTIADYVPHGTAVRSGAR